MIDPEEVETHQDDHEAEPAEGEKGQGTVTEDDSDNDDAVEEAGDVKPAA